MKRLLNILGAVLIVAGLGLLCAGDGITQQIGDGLGVAGLLCLWKASTCV